MDCRLIREGKLFEESVTLLAEWLVKGGRDGVVFRLGYRGLACREVQALLVGLMARHQLSLEQHADILMQMDFTLLSPILPTLKSSIPLSKLHSLLLSQPCSHLCQIT